MAGLRRVATAYARHPSRRGLPLAQARGVRRFRRSTGPAHAFGAAAYGQARPWH